jgi:hypothetical protein
MQKKNETTTLMKISAALLSLLVYLILYTSAILTTSTKVAFLLGMISIIFIDLIVKVTLNARKD